MHISSATSSGLIITGADSFQGSSGLIITGANSFQGSSGLIITGADSFQGSSGLIITGAGVHNSRGSSPYRQRQFIKSTGSSRVVV